MRYSPYPQYKESGVQSLGKVPEDWDVKRGRFTMRVNPPALKLRGLKDDAEVSFVPMEAVNEFGGLELSQTRIKAEVGGGYTEFQEGDVVVAKITPCFENGKGSLAAGLINSVAFGTTELHVLRAEQKLDNRFLFFLTITDGYRKLGESEMYGAGGQKRVPPEFCKDFRTPLPPISEQTAIADFLDRETGRIDTLVAKKRRLIALLKEKRTVLISRTVTRGLPEEAAREFGLEPHTRFKDSGVEWLGEVPEGWGKARKLSHFARDEKNSFVNGPFGSDLLSTEIVEEGVPVIYIRDISSGKYRRKSEGHVTKEKAEHLRFCDVIPHDILIAKVGDPPGTAVVYPEGEAKAIVTQDVIRLRVNLNEVSPGFLTYFLNSSAGRGLIDQVAIESTRMRVGLGDYKGSLAVVPPFVEQAAIATYLDRETTKIDRLIEKVDTAIHLLQEYRTALITAAVTGKIDVRNAAQEAAA